MNNLLTGILGGMGPLASSGFINFLYEKCCSKFSDEQSYPRIILVSDPTIPDRIIAANSNNVEKIVAIFERKIEEFLLLGADRILICCFTAYYFLKFLSEKSQKNIINLGELLKNYLNKHQKETLILCSKLLASSRLIDSPYAVYPDQIYFDRIHQLIYQIKLNGPTLYQDELVFLVQLLCKLYNVSQVLLACSEFHLVYQKMPLALINSDEIYILDGLNIMADFIISENLK